MLTHFHQKLADMVAARERLRGVVRKPPVLPFGAAFLFGCVRLIATSLGAWRLASNLAIYEVPVRMPIGGTIVLRPFSDDPIAVNEVQNWCSYESLAEIHAGQVILDIGAHIGAFSIRAAQLVGPEGKVVAVEPEAENFRLLKLNCRLNGLNNVIPCNVGASSSPGKRELHTNLSGQTATHSFEQAAIRTDYRSNSPFRSVTVNCDTVDRICANLGLPPIDLIKVDAEGHEIQVLEGAVGVLSRDRPSVVAEVEPAYQPQFREWMVRHGYKSVADRRHRWIFFSEPVAESARGGTEAAASPGERRLSRTTSQT